MLKTGKIQTLEIVDRKDHGVYLAEKATATREERVLLPAAQVPEGSKIGDSLRVFLYRDSEDRLIATTREPALEAGGIALLRVKEVTKIGAFLDWGLEKDLFLPFREQTKRLRPDDEILAAMYVDKSDRLCATMKLYPYLRKDPPYVVGDEVRGRVYEISGNFGVFLAVDDRYSALIPRQEAQDTYVPGNVLDLRVTEVKEDGKLTVSARRKAYLQIGEDAGRILEELRECEGELPFDDKASPDVIAARFGISKAAFKRAVGHLLREGLIEKADGALILK